MYSVLITSFFSLLSCFFLPSDLENGRNFTIATEHIA